MTNKAFSYVLNEAFISSRGDLRFNLSRSTDKNARNVRKERYESNTGLLLAEMKSLEVERNRCFKLARKQTGAVRIALFRKAARLLKEIQRRKNLVKKHS